MMGIITLNSIPLTYSRVLPSIMYMMAVNRRITCTSGRVTLSCLGSLVLGSSSSSKKDEVMKGRESPSRLIMLVR